MSNEMSSRTVAFAGIAICLIAAIAVLVLAIISGTRMIGGLLGFVLPYGILAFFLWRQRGHMTISCVLTGVSIILSSWALYLTGVDAYRYQTEPNYHLLQRWAPFLVLVGQWVVALVVSVGFVVVWFVNRRVSHSK